MKTIQRRRGAIDQIDGELVRLLNQRTELAIEIARLKQQFGLGRVSRIREREILARARRHSTGPLDKRAVVRIFREILRESRRSQAARLSARGQDRRARQ